MDRDDILGRWIGYILELYAEDKGQAPSAKMIKPSISMYNKVKNALSRRETGKTAGPDNLPIELVLALEELGIDVT